MGTWTWNLVDAVDKMQRDLDFLLGKAPAAGARLPFSRFSFLPARSARAYPLINVSEDDDNFYIDALAPGVDPASLDVSIKNDQLTISGQKRGPNGAIAPEAFHRNERAAGRFLRSISLTAAVESEKISADYVNGLLRIVLPKAEVAKARKIEISVG